MVHSSRFLLASGPRFAWRKASNVLTVLFVGMPLALQPVLADPERPNILFLAIDDLRPELGCYGEAVISSPNIDRFASQRMLFEGACCQFPVCGASRASTMTGILPTATRFVDYLANNRFRPRRTRGMVNGSKEYKTYDLGDFDDQSDAFYRKMRHGYFAFSSFIDQLVGNVLAELETLDLAKNTVVVVWGDHGWHLGKHTFWGKHNTLHNAIRIPFIVRAPMSSSSWVMIKDFFGLRRRMTTRQSQALFTIREHTCALVWVK